MKYSLFLLLFSFSLSSFGKEKQLESMKAIELKVDKNLSMLEWKGSKKLVDSAHHGTISLKEGSLSLKGDNLSAGQVVLDMNSIKNLDVEKPEWKSKLENHLKSDDFFNVKKFPEAKFVISSSTRRGNDLTLKGNLTVKGISHPIELKGSVLSTGKTYTFTGTKTIDRTKWDIRYNSDKFFDPNKLGDKIIRDEIEIKLKIVAKQS